MVSVPRVPLLRVCSTCHEGRPLKDFAPRLSVCRLCISDLSSRAPDGKFCYGCQQWKSPSEFHKTITRKDGLDSQCKVCKAAYVDKYRRVLAQKQYARLLLKGKSCCVCGAQKPRYSFVQDCFSPDGFRGVCKLCERSEKAKEKWFSRNEAKVKARREKKIAECPERLCKVCGTISPGKTREQCPGCAEAYNRLEKDKYLRLAYGISLLDYDRLFAEQSGRRAICGTETPGGHRDFCVDHCHATNAVRGLLCVNCNWLLGNAKDDPENLRVAAVYLERSREREV